MLRYSAGDLDPRREWLVRENIAWLDRYGAPIVIAIAAEDGLASQWRIQDAARALHESTLTEDQKRCLSLRLRYFRWQMEHDFAEHQLQQRMGATQSILASLSVPQETPLAESYRNAMLMQVLIHDEAEGGAPLAEPVMARHFNAVLPEHMDQEFWYYATNWAFRHRYRKCLDWAREAIPRQADGYISNYLRQRLNLMILLLEGQARPEDMLEMVARLRSLRHLRAFMHLIYDSCVQAGIVTAEVTAALRAREAELEATGTFVPQHAVGAQPPRGDF